jgi:hypothetical protein
MNSLRAVIALLVFLEVMKWPCQMSIQLKTYAKTYAKWSHA